MSDPAFSPAACRAARALLNWSIRDLAAASRVAFTTIHRLESGGVPQRRTLQRIVAAFAGAGVAMEVSPGRAGAMLFASPMPTRRAAAEAIVEGIVRIARAARKGDRESGLRGNQLSTLVTIRYNPGITLKVLARLEGVSHPSMSRLTGQMINAGWVQRERAPDARFQRLSLTDTGHRLFEQAWERRVSAMMRLTGSLQRSTAADLALTLQPVADEIGLARERLGRSDRTGSSEEA